MVSIDIADVVTEVEACRQHCLPGREMVEKARPSGGHCTAY